MSFDLTSDFTPLDINELDLAITATHSNCLARLVKFANVSNRITSVKVADLLDHTDVPDFEDSIRVARCNILTSNGEATVIDCVEMTEECLNSQAGSHIPN